MATEINRERRHAGTSRTGDVKDNGRYTLLPPAMKGKYPSADSSIVGNRLTNPFLAGTVVFKFDAESPDADFDPDGTPRNGVEWGPGGGGGSHRANTGQTGETSMRF